MVKKLKRIYMFLEETIKKELLKQALKMIVLILQGMYNVKHPNEIKLEEHAYPSSIITVRISGITFVCLLCYK